MVFEIVGKHFPARALEWFVAGVVMLPWGLYVLAHPTLFTDPRISAVFAPMADMAWFWPPHISWGLTAVCVALIRLCALWINGSRPVSTPRIRLVASFLSVFIWTQVFVGMLKSDVPNTGLVVYTSLIVADIYSIVRATRDVVLTSRDRLIAKQAREGFRYVERNAGGILVS